MRFTSMSWGVLFVVGSTGALVPSTSAEPRVFYAAGSGDDIGRADLDGSNQELLVTGMSNVQCLDVDADIGKIYWADSTTDWVQRADMDGSEVEVIATASNARGIAVDRVHGKVYWTDGDSVYSADLDGSNPQGVVFAGDPYGVAVDTVNSKLYWTVLSGALIQRSDLDGSNTETLLTLDTSNAPRDIVLDVDGGKMYWVSDELVTEPWPKIWRASLNGDSPELLWSIDPGDFWVIEDLALDLSAGKLYWVEQHGEFGPNFRRCNLDGSGDEMLTPLDAGALDIAEWTDPNIPAVSTWGLAAMALVVAAAGSVLLRQRHLARPAMQA